MPTTFATPRAVVPLENPRVKAAIILLAGLFIYAPVFSGGWLMDDDYELTDNPALRSVAGLAKIWRGEVGADYLPLKTSVQWVLWQIFGNHPTPFHLASIALHLLSAVLLWRLLERLGMRHGWLGGLLFAVHPIEVESVAWVSELKNTLSLAILLPAMLAWVSFDEQRRGRDYAWALALFLAALLCKSSVIMLPVVILLYAWWKRGRIGQGDDVTDESAVFRGGARGGYFDGLGAMGAFRPHGGLPAGRSCIARGACRDGHRLLPVENRLPGGLAAHVPAVADRSTERLGVSACGYSNRFALLVVDERVMPRGAGLCGSEWAFFSSTCCRCSASSKCHSCGSRGCRTIWSTCPVLG